jgi:predicted MFS family arabinose efflux permease
MRQSLASLRLPGLPRLAGAFALGELGDSLAAVALAVVVFGRSGSVLATGAFFVAARVGPAIVSQPLMALLDRLPGRRWIVASYAAEAVLLLLLAAPLPLGALIVVPFATGSLAVCARGLTRAETAVRLGRVSRLRQGNAAINLAFAGAATAGAAAGGALCSLASPATALVVAAACFAAAGVLCATTARERPPAESETVWSHLREGLHHARRDRGAMALIAVQTAAMTAFTLVIPVEVVYAERELGVGAAGYGALLATWGVGILVGGAVFARARSALGLLAATSTLLIATGYLGLAVAPNLAIACALSLLGGAGNGIQWIAVMTSLQERLPEALQVRVVGLLDAGAQLALGIGFAAGTLLTAALSARATYGLAGLGSLAAALALYLQYARSRRLGAVEPAPA